MRKFKNISDEALVSLLQQGDASAFDEIYARYSKPLLAFIYRMVNQDEGIAQDVLHDVFLILIEKPSLFDPKRKFKSWIFTVAANSSRKVHRIKKTKELETVSKVYTAVIHQPNLTDKSQFNRLLNQYLNQMSQQHREVFILKHQQLLSIKEISVILDIPEGTVKSRLYTVSRKLAKKLKQFNPKKAL